MSEPVRVLQVVTHMNRGGLETMLMNYYRHIDRSKVQFDFLVHRAARGDYDDEIESLGGRIFRLPRLVPWSIGYQKALDGFFKAHPEYRIVHVHQDCLSSVILKAAKRNHIPVRIAHSHSSSQDKDLKYPIKLLCKRSIPRYATRLFACGKGAGEWMFGGAPFQILNNAIDASAYRFDRARAMSMRQALHLPENALVLGHVGRFSYPKNHDFLIDIFSALLKKEPAACLLLVGDGDLRPKAEEKVRSLGIMNRVIFTGIRSDVPDLLQAMDVFVFPSIYEGLPVTLVEAQAAGLPCVISDGIPSDCDLTDRICRVPLRDSPERWANQILSALAIPRTDTYREIVNAGFDIHQNARRLTQFYLQRWEENCVCSKDC